MAQLYVRDSESGLPRPPRELKGFESCTLSPGESTTLNFELNQDAFSYYDPENTGWVLEPGEFVIEIGRSSRNIALQKEIVLSK